MHDVHTLSNASPDWDPVGAPHTHANCMPLVRSDCYSNAMQRLPIGVSDELPFMRTYRSSDSGTDLRPLVRTDALPFVHPNTLANSISIAEANDSCTYAVPFMRADAVPFMCANAVPFVRAHALPLLRTDCDSNALHQLSDKDADADPHPDAYDESNRATNNTKVPLLRKIL